MWHRPSTPGQDLDEGAEVRDALDRAGVARADLGRLAHAPGSPRRRPARACASMPKTCTLPLSSTTEILTLYCSCSALMFLPPGPIRKPIFSAGICSGLHARRVLGDRRRSGAARPRASSRRMNLRPARAWSSARSSSSRVTLLILMSICSAVMPMPEPATLKSMSPWWSSEPRMSERIAMRSPSWTRPMAMPATGCESGTPASIIDEAAAAHARHRRASRSTPVMSETMRIV